MSFRFRTRLPGASLDYHDARTAVDVLQAGAWARLPYTARVHVQNILRRAEPGLIESFLRQLIGRKRELDFPWFPVHVVCHDILGQTALVDLAGLRDAIADQGGDPAAVNSVVPVQLIVDHSLAVECGGFDPQAFEKNRVMEDRRNEDLWQAKISKTIVAHIPITNGLVQETGDFELDGVTFPAAEVPLEFLDPAGEGDGEGGSAMFPTGQVVDDLVVPGVGTFRATMVNAGIPAILVNAQDIGYTGMELQDAINDNPQALARFETIRAHGAIRMGLIGNVEEAAKRQHTPKVAFVAPPSDYVASSGKTVKAGDVDLLVRAVSMGKLHHAMMGTAAAIPGTLVNLAVGGGDARLYASATPRARYAYAPKQSRSRANGPCPRRL
ncbi:PrpF domain-containing protein [Xanthomonas axonopodis]|uniref:PrpF domain-containing protein n=1 Tax=Xanthomonas axonopodis TaxID=53413 RepID=UPI003557D1FE